MGKILFVSSTPLHPNAFDGKEKRALSILESISRKNEIDIVCIDQNKDKEKKNIKFCNNITRFKISFFLRFLNTFLSLVKLGPLQNGYFYSKEMFNFINNSKDNYDTIIFHLIRCAQYLPSDFKGKTILEMTDLVSVRDKQIIKGLSIINPLRYLYILENFLMKKYEIKVSNKFDKVVFITKKELFQAKKFIEKNKIVVIENNFNLEKKINNFNKKNKKIIFLGNINYLPNKLACYEFSKYILPKINEKYPDIEFHIIGKINIFDKLLLKFFNNVEIHGPISNLRSAFKNSICGICNVRIATGFQNKILNYMSFGIPVIVSKESFVAGIFKINTNVCVFKKNEDLINLVIKLKENKKLANKLSFNSSKILKNNFNSMKILKKYQNIIK